MAHATDGMQLNIAAKYLKAALEVVSRDKTRPALTGVHLQFDANGLWRIESTDSYRLFRVETKEPYIPSADDVDIIIPAETIKQLKVTDAATVEVLDAEERRYVLKRTPKSSTQTARCEFSPIDRDYPNTDILMPKSPIPSACYRMALGFSPDFVMSLLKAARMCVKGAVELATLEGGKAKPMYGMTSDDGARVTFLVMPCKVEHSALGKAVTQNPDTDRLSALEQENERLRVQLKTAEEQCRKESGRDGKTDADESLKLQERLADMEKLLNSMRVESEGLRRKAEEWKRKAEEAANASAKASVSDVAEATSLEEMAKWCKGHAGTKARRKGNGPVWVTGNTKPCKDELASMGFKYGFHKEFGKGWWRK